MSDAIIVTKAYKKFGKNEDSFWTRLPWFKSSNNRNGHSGEQPESKPTPNGKGRFIVALDRVSSPYLLACGCLVVRSAMPSVLENYTEMGNIRILLIRYSGAAEEVEDADYD